MPKEDLIRKFIRGYIEAHEGGLSLDPKDNGNWTGGKSGVGNLVGSKYGVTAGALAVYRKVPVQGITRDSIEKLTLDEAVDIGVKLFYKDPKLDLLPLNRVTLSVVDKGWGSGPKQAIKLLQRMTGTTQDGVVGPKTVKEYEEFLKHYGEEEAAKRWCETRVAFDTSLGQTRFIKGWNNRSRSFLPGTRWWDEWKIIKDV